MLPIGEIDIGIVGLGSIARRMHLPVLSAFEDVNIVAAADIDERAGRKVVEKWGISGFYTDYAKMYEDVNLDIVFVCLPNNMHYEAVLNALKSGLNVFCEKPLGTSPEDAYELVKVSNEKGLILGVGYNKCFNQNYVRSRRIIKNLLLGKVVQVHGILVNPGPFGWSPNSAWFFDERSGGVLYDSGCHIVHLIHYILDDRITEVSADSTSTTGLDIPDNIVCTFRTDKGTVGTINVGWNAGVLYNAVQVHGTAGSLLSSPHSVEKIFPGEDSLDKTLKYLRAIKDALGKDVMMGMTRGDTSDEKMTKKARVDVTYLKEDRLFIDSVINSTKPPVTGEDALRVLEVLEGIKQASKSRKIVGVAYHEL